MDTSKLKPFDLERALAGDPVVVKWDIPNSSGCMYLNVHSINTMGDEITYSFGENGIGWSKLKPHNTRDLFMAPKTRDVWVNIYEGWSGTGTPTVEIARNKNEADEDWAITKKSWPELKRVGNCAHKITVEE